MRIYDFEKEDTIEYGAVGSNGPKQFSEYSKRYRLHAVKLYREYNSSIKVIKILRQESLNGKWAYTSQPMPATILKWSRKYDPDIEDEDKEIDPDIREDMELLSTVRILQKKSRSALRNMNFKDMREVIAALHFSFKTRKEIRAALNERKGDIIKGRDKIEKSLRNTLQQQNRIKKEVKEASLLGLEAIDFIKEKERRDSA